MISPPWFEDFNVGDDFSNVPSVTLTEGYAALHQSMFADRLRLPLDKPLSFAVTGRHAFLANTSLVGNMAIGQSTVPSQRVIGNLFYRGMVFRKPVFIGDTLTTQTRLIALRQNRIREGRAATGMIVLEIHVHNQHDETVMHFWRCPMIPCRDPDADTGRNDSLDTIPETIADDDLANAVPDWDYPAYVGRVPGCHYEDYHAGSSFIVEARDTITSAPELARLTLNLAMPHTDAGRSVYGKRLVYGGHTISMAAAQLSRAIPNLMSILAWYRCDHSAPVFEGDILDSVVTIDDRLDLGSAGILKLHVEVHAHRGEEAPEPGEHIKVLDWQLAGLMAKRSSQYSK